MSNMTRRETIAAGLASAVMISVPLVVCADEVAPSDGAANPATSTNAKVVTDPGKAALAVGCRFDRSF